MCFHISVFCPPSAKVLHSFGYVALESEKLHQPCSDIQKKKSCFPVRGSVISTLLNYRNVGKLKKYKDFFATYCQDKWGFSEDFVSYFKVCYSISNSVDHVNKPDYKTIQSQLTSLLHHRNQQLPLPSSLFVFLVYRHTSVFHVDCIEHFFSVWVSFESAGINRHFLFFYIVTMSYGCSFEEWFLIFLFPTMNTDAEECFFLFKCCC